MPTGGVQHIHTDHAPESSMREFLSWSWAWINCLSFVCPLRSILGDRPHHIHLHPRWRTQAPAARLTRSRQLPLRLALLLCSRGLHDGRAGRPAQRPRVPQADVRPGARGLLPPKVQLRFQFLLFINVSVHFQQMLTQSVKKERR